MCVTTRDIARIRELRYEDGLSCSQVARLFGCSATTVRRYAPGQPGKVSTEPLRSMFEVVQSRGLTAPEIARRMGWFYLRRDRPTYDGSRVRRCLGVDEEWSRGYTYRREFIDAETAGLLAEAMGFAAWEATG